MLIEAPIGNIFADDSTLVWETIDWLDLTWQECMRRAIDKPTRGGVQVRILLRLGATLRHGDLVYGNAEPARAPIAVHILPCPVVVARPRNPIEWAKLAYELGNLHVPIELLPDRLVTICDGPVEAALYRVDVPFETEMRRFEPLRGSGMEIALADGFTINRDRPPIGQTDAANASLPSIEAPQAPNS